jgi:hypothetical protein
VAYLGDFGAFLSLGIIADIFWNASRNENLSSIDEDIPK